MRITIKYDSSWHSSFLDEDEYKSLFNANDEALKNYKKREFKATSKSDFKNETPITKNTVLGIMCRLVGDQRKLHVAKLAADYYFKDIEHLISDPIPKATQSQEIVMLVNKSDTRPAPTKMVGAIKDYAGLFFSEVAPVFWSVLYLDIQDLLKFILDTEFLNQTASSSPSDLIYRIKDIQKIDTLITKEKLLEQKDYVIGKSYEKLRISEEKQQAQDQNDKKLKGLIKSIEKQKTAIKLLEEERANIFNSLENAQFDNLLLNSLSLLEKKYPKSKKEDKEEDNRSVAPIRLYASALYLQLERMEAAGYSIQKLIEDAKDRKIPGFSKYGFNGIRELLNRFSSGNGKKTVKTPVEITKSSGQFDIFINVDEERAKKIKQDIDNAGVSSFYLGKKGLAYIDGEIRV